MGTTPEIGALLDLVNQHFDRAGQPRARGASAAELRLLRQAFEFELPEQLMQWLSVCHGGRVNAVNVEYLMGTNEVWSIVGSIQSIEHPEQDRWVPVANDGCGDYFCLVCGENAAAPAPVIFVDHETDDTFLVGSSLFKFLEIELSEPPFDPAVDRDPPYFDRKRFFAIDPDAEKVRGLRYRWEAYKG